MTSSFINDFGVVRTKYPITSGGAAPRPPATVMHLVHIQTSSFINPYLLKDSVGAKMCDDGLMTL